MTRNRDHDDCEFCGKKKLTAFFAIDGTNGQNLWVCCRCYIEEQRRKHGGVREGGPGPHTRG